MTRLLLESPLLLLFAVTGTGYLVGRIRLGTFNLGVAAILFVGLAFGALHPDMMLPEFVYQFGLVLFVYTMGLTSGPGFFASFRRRGLRDNLFALGLLTIAAAVAFGSGRLLGLKGAVVAGLFAGSLTNTPALAGVLETLQATGAGGETGAAAGLARAIAAPVVAYSLAYPFGVMGVILAMHHFARAWRVDFRREAAARAEKGEGEGGPVVNLDVEITRQDVTGVPVRDLFGPEPGPHVVISRLKRGDRQLLVDAATTFQPGDVVTLVGTQAEVERFAPRLGEPSQEHLTLDRSQLDFRRIFVSSPEVAGKRIRDLRLHERFGATITRVKRGDVDLAPSADMVLDLGDRVRVVSHHKRLEAVAAFFGDSYRQLSEIDIPSFSLGIALGLLVGLVPVPLPGGTSFRLGFAGGPLVVALVLGALGRTGRIVWNQSYSASLTLRQLGLVLFLAGIGTRSGYAFASTVRDTGPAIVAAGAVITLSFSALTLLAGYRLLRIPMGVLSGMLAGMQTQPAALAFASEQAGSDLPGVGYATVYPTAMVAKILLAQVLLSALG